MIQARMNCKSYTIVVTKVINGGFKDIFASPRERLEVLSSMNGRP